MQQNKQEMTNGTYKGDYIAENTTVTVKDGCIVQIKRTYMQ